MKNSLITEVLRINSIIGMNPKEINEDLQTTEQHLKNIKTHFNSTKPEIFV